MVFDEMYYALDAADLLRHGVESNAAHPPLAKWLIAGGIRLVGFTPDGLAAWPRWWPASSLVLLTWAAARKVTTQRGLALAAGAARGPRRHRLTSPAASPCSTSSWPWPRPAAAWCVLAALVDRADPGRLRRWRWAAAVLPRGGHRHEVGGGVDVAGRRRSCWWASSDAWPPRAGPGGASPPRPWPCSPWCPWASTWPPTPRGSPRPSGPGPGWPTARAPSRAVSAPSTGSRCGSTTSGTCSSSTPGWRPTTPRRLRPGTGPRRPTPPTCSASPAARRWPRRPASLDDGVCPDADELTETRVLSGGQPRVVGRRACSRSGVASGSVVRRRDDAAGVVLALAAAQWLPWMLSGREVYSYYAVSLVPLLALATVLALDRLPASGAGRSCPCSWARPWPSSSCTRCSSGEALTPDAADLRLLLPGWSSSRARRVGAGSSGSSPSVLRRRAGRHLGPAVRRRRRGGRRQMGRPPGPGADPALAGRRAGHLVDRLARGGPCG